MKNIPRLLDSDTDLSMRELLATGLADRPNPDAARRVAVGLGLSAASVAMVTAGAASAAVSSGLAVAASSILVTAGQWIAIGLLGGVTVVGMVPWAAGSLGTHTPAVPTRTIGSGRVGRSSSASARADALPKTEPATPAETDEHSVGRIRSSRDMEISGGWR